MANLSISHAMSSVVVNNVVLRNNASAVLVTHVESLRTFSIKQMICGTTFEHSVDEERTCCTKPIVLNFCKAGVSLDYCGFSLHSDWLFIEILL